MKQLIFSFLSLKKKYLTHTHTHTHILVLLYLWGPTFFPIKVRTYLWGPAILVIFTSLWGPKLRGPLCVCVCVTCEDRSSEIQQYKHVCVCVCVCCERPNEYAGSAIHHAHALTKTVKLVSVWVLSIGQKQVHRGPRKLGPHRDVNITKMAGPHK